MKAMAPCFRFQRMRKRESPRRPAQGLGQTGGATKGRKDELVKAGQRRERMAGKSKDQLFGGASGEQEWFSWLHGNPMNDNSGTDLGYGARDVVVVAD